MSTTSGEWNWSPATGSSSTIVEENQLYHSMVEVAAGIYNQGVREGKTFYRHYGSSRQTRGLYEIEYLFKTKDAMPWYNLEKMSWDMIRASPAAMGTLFEIGYEKARLVYLDNKAR